MFAFVSNEYSGIVYSKQQVKVLSRLYTYTVAQFCTTEQEARDFIKRNPRHVYSHMKSAGWKKTTAYIRVEYFIADETIYANLYTDHFGFVQLKIVNNPNILQSATYDLIKLKIPYVNVRDESITSHCAAIIHILSLMSPIINVQIKVPDISIYMALTEYSGRNATIKNTQKYLKSRIGKVALLL